MVKQTRMLSYWSPHSLTNNFTTLGSDHFDFFDFSIVMAWHMLHFITRQIFDSIIKGTVKSNYDGLDGTLYYGRRKSCMIANIGYE